MGKEYKVRHSQKTDTSANWALAANFKPLKGEIIIYSDLKKFKVGDGEKTVGQLDFYGADIDLSDYATIEYVDEEISQALGGYTPDIDLNDYATKNYVDDAIDNITASDIGALPVDGLSSIISVEENGAVSLGASDLNTNMGQNALVAGRENASNGDFSSAVGYENVAGCKGYYIAAIDSINHYIYLSDSTASLENGPIPSWSTRPTTTAKPAYEIGDEFSVSAPSYYHWVFAGKITQIDNNRIIYETNEGMLEKSPTDTHRTKWNGTHSQEKRPMRFYVPTKPDIGLISLGEGASVIGRQNVAADDYCFAEGCANIAAGYASHVEGELTQAGYTGHAEGYGTKAWGLSSHAEGYGTTAIGDFSHASGYYTKAGGKASTAEGSGTIASGLQSHAEGGETQALGAQSHAEGGLTIAHKTWSHAGGRLTEARGEASFAHGEALEEKTDENGKKYALESDKTIAYGTGSTAMGVGSQAIGNYAVAMGYDTTAGIFTEDNSPSGTSAVALGYKTTASNTYAIAMGYQSEATAQGSIALGRNTTAGITEDSIPDPGSGIGAIAMGNGAKALAEGAVSIGSSTVAKGKWSNATGGGTIAEGMHSVAQGSSTIASGSQSVASGRYAKAIGQGSFAHGILVKEPDTGKSPTDADKTIAEGKASVAIGSGNKTYGEGSVAIGFSNTAGLKKDGKLTGKGSVALGYLTVASSVYSFAGGYGSEASASAAVAFGDHSKAEGANSFAAGYYTEATGSASFAHGRDSTMATGISATAIGTHAQAIQNHATAIGYYTKASGEYSTAIGKKSVASGENSFAIAGGQAKEKDSVAIGTSSSAVYLPGTLSVGSKLTARSALSVNGALTANSTLTAAGKVTANNGITTKGLTSTDKVSVTGNIDASGKISSTGANIARTASDRVDIASFHAWEEPEDSIMLRKTEIRDANIKILSGNITLGAGPDEIPDFYVINLNADTVTMPGFKNSAEDLVITIGDDYRAVSLKQGSNYINVNQDGIYLNAGFIKTNDITIGKDSISAPDSLYLTAEAINLTGNIALDGDTLNLLPKKINISNDSAVLKIQSDSNYGISIDEKTVKFNRSSNATGPFLIAGYNCKATGNNSIAIGSDALAPYSYSVAIGRGAKADGTYALSVGSYTTASSYGAAFGYSTYAAYASLAAGFGSQASADYTAAFGQYAQATATGALVYGNGSLADALGYNTLVGGWHSIANYACNIVAGNALRAANMNCAVFGQYNSIYDHNGNAFIKFDNQAALIIGNGTSDSNRSNAFTVTKDGNAYVANQLTSNSVSTGTLNFTSLTPSSIEVLKKALNLA